MSARITLILLILLAFASLLTAQTTTQTATVATTATTDTTASTTAPEQTRRDGPMSGEEVRAEFTNLLSQGPSELPTILKLDPTLLSNDAYLTGYPELQRFVAAHPEVRRNPRYYLSAFRDPGDGSRALDQLMETVAIISVFGMAMLALTWLVRTIIEQKRWTRLSRTQSEVHNKILDRFSSSEELLAYIKTQAGTKFLESAPIPLHAATQPIENTPVARALRSIQIGVIAAIGSIGVILVSNRFDKESAQGIFALGSIAFAIGVGFIASAVIAIILSRRLNQRLSQEAEIVQ